MPAIELQPLTDAQRDAIRACRFVTPNLARSHAWAWTADPAVVAVLVPGRTEATPEERAAAAAAAPAVGSATRYTRSREPEVLEWELTLTHPDAVALACDIADGRRG